MLFSMEDDGEEMNNLAEKAESDAEIRKKIEELQNILGDENSLHKISQEAFHAQWTLREELYQSGWLEKELKKRGFHYDGQALYYLP